MKSLVITVCLLVGCIQSKEIYKDYRGGRPKFSNVRLTLYTDSTYIFSERFDFPGITRDTGRWRMSNHKLILASNPQAENSRSIFKQDTFDIVNNKLLLFPDDDDKAFNKIYRTLKEVSD